jgi:hypothetical protein
MLMGHKRFKVDIIIRWMVGVSDVAQGVEGLVDVEEDRGMI